MWVCKCVWMCGCVCKCLGVCASVWVSAGVYVVCTYKSQETSQCQLDSIVSKGDQNLTANEPRETELSILEVGTRNLCLAAQKGENLLWIVNDCF